MHTLKVALTLLATSLCGGSLMSCSDPETTSDMGKTPDMRPLPDLLPAVPKAIYTLTNDVNDNQVAIFTRTADGTLSPGMLVSTAGRGTGAGLGDQGALTFDKVKKRFYAVNAGDNSISLLSLKDDGTVVLLSKRLSGGVRPVSITAAGDTVYVVNAGDNFEKPNISGFTVTGDMLIKVDNSIKDLPTLGSAPAQISFTPDGLVLVVTEKQTNKISTFTVQNNLATGPNVQNSNNTTPFGFAFSASGKLIVSEAAMAAANGGTTSSYSVATNGTLTTISNKVALNQTAPCWVAVSGTNAYVTNAQSNNVSAFKVATDGTLTLVGNGANGMTGMGPTDVAVTEDNQFLYTLNGRDHTFSIFSIAQDGSLTKKSDFTGAPMTAVGLVAR